MQESPHLISKVSSARPKVADYPFTTLEPNLGVVRDKAGNSFVIADIPGLIPGAHKGKGLGIKFLKHIERTKIILHLIDPLQLDENSEYQTLETSFDLINTELKHFSEILSKKTQIIVITKIDALNEELMEKLRQESKAFIDQGYQVHLISSLSGDGLEDLIEAISSALE